MQTMSSLRILAVAERTYGLNGASYVSAFRRLGHSVLVVDEGDFFAPGLQNRVMRAMRRLAFPMLARDFNAFLQAEIVRFEPDVLFVFKGPMVRPDTIDAAKANGTVTVNYYPDTGYASHSPLLPLALPRYDWCFTSKSFGPRDYLEQLGTSNCSYLPHSFDPEIHRPIELSGQDIARYRADLGFVGAWSQKKQSLVQAASRAHPDLSFNLYGGGRWFRHIGELPGIKLHGQVLALEFSKACAGAGINLGLLYEGASDSSSPDKTTSRTFDLTAMGAFMLHERTDELLEFFEEDREVACFEGPDELAEKIAEYHAQPDLRAKIGAAARERAFASGYSIDVRAQIVLEKARSLS